MKYPTQVVLCLDDIVSFCEYGDRADEFRDKFEKALGMTYEQLVAEYEARLEAERKKEEQAKLAAQAKEALEFLAIYNFEGLADVDFKSAVEITCRLAVAMRNETTRRTKKENEDE